MEATKAATKALVFHNPIPPFKARHPLTLDLPIPVPKFQGQNFHNNKRIVDAIKLLAQRKGCTLTQIALAWVMAQDMIPIPGTTKAQRLEENFASGEIVLSEDEKSEMRRILDDVKPEGNRYGERAQSMVGH